MQSRAAHVPQGPKNLRMFNNSGVSGFYKRIIKYHRILGSEISHFRLVVPMRGESRLGFRVCVSAMYLGGFREGMYQQRIQSPIR